jgi:hypothetical protein
MRQRLARYGAVIAAVTALAAGGSAIAAATQTSPTKVGSPAVTHIRASHSTARAHRGATESPNEQESSAEAESTAADGDASAQAAACQKAGIDPNASNVNYDDATGACSLDTGSSNN